MRQRVNRLPIALLFLVLCGTATAAATTTQPLKVARPTEVIEPAKCVTAECHSGVKDYKALHGPVNVNTCDACHTLLDAKTHTFAMAREKAELCTYCHEFNAGKMPVVHKPVTNGECLGCHDPHGGRTTALVRGNSTAEMCGRCHESVAHNKRFLHTPVSNGECDSCHPSHASRFPKLLDAQDTELCLSCHAEFASQLGIAKFTHKAMREGCSKCHDAHGSDYLAVTRQSVPDLCMGCHEKVKNEVAGAKYTHSVVMANRSCQTCHTPHGSDYANLMSDLPVRICMDCHSQKVKTDKGRIVAAMPELSDPKTIKHGPIKEGQCSGCHSSHGGDRPYLLAKAYEEVFYQRATPQHYDLCFSCHDARLVQRDQGTGLTGFRNGDRNLHYVHVDKSEKSRGCSVCHSMHASNRERHVRDWVKFGQWRLPINYQRTATGGSCVSGCHATYAYDREKPVPPPTTAPSPRNPPAASLARHSAPPPVRFTAKAVTGVQVNVPDPTRPTVLLFVRPGHDQTPRAIRLIGAAVQDPRRTQVVVILCGPKADEEAKAIADAKTPPWPIIADVEYARTGPLGIHTWPATLVVESDGTQVAHIGGAPQALTVEVEAYVDLAAKRIDRATLEQRLAKHQLVAEEPAKRTARLLRMAEQLLDEGKPDQARTVLADGLKLQPTATPLQAGMIKALIQLKQGKEALDLLQTLPPKTLPAWEASLLRGRALVALERWDEAKLAIALALKSKPDLGDAHYLMGAVYEHEKDWPNAAREYRAAREAGRAIRSNVAEPGQTP